MKIVTNTTPIISLIKADKLDLLDALFTEVMMPVAVYRELTASKMFVEEANIIDNAQFIKIAPVKDMSLLHSIQSSFGLDAGESEAIALANEVNADLLIIDERKGRRVARDFGCKITGTMGVLLFAYKNGMLLSSEVMECINKLKAAHIWISNSLVEIVRSIVQV